MFGRLNEEEMPSKAYSGLKMEGMEENEVRAEKLSEVSAKSDAQEDFLTTTVDGSGTVKIKKGARDQSMPKSSEELRARLTVMGNM
eukprot:1374732-Karenia_brevis.AAC.1